MLNKLFPENIKKLIFKPSNKNNFYILSLILKYNKHIITHQTIKTFVLFLGTDLPKAD